MSTRSCIIVGGGSIGKRHARNIFALGGWSISFVEPDAKRATDLEGEFSVRTYPSLEAAYAAQHFDCACICSPSIRHLEQATFCAHQGSDLFIEKPLSHTTMGLDKLMAEVTQRKLVTFVGSNMKFYPSFQTMKTILDSGVLGKIFSVRCQFGQYLPDWHPWEDYTRGYSANKKLGGGILSDCHEFDYLTWFITKPVKSISCFADTVGLLPIDVEDVAEVLFQFEDKTIAELHADYIQRFYQRNFEFFGELGTMIWDGTQKMVTVRLKDQDEQRYCLPETYDSNDMYRDEMKHFFECVSSRHETITPLHHAINVVKLVEAAKKSAVSGKHILVN